MRTTRSKFLQAVDLVQDAINEAGDSGILLIALPAKTGLTYIAAQQASQYLRIRKLIHYKRENNFYRLFAGPNPPNLWNPRTKAIGEPGTASG